MKKIILSSLAAFAISATANAGSVSADLRADYDATSYNDDAKSAGKDGAAKFCIHTGRLDFKGNLNEEVSYRMRLRFNKDRAVSARDSLGLDTDFAYISNKLNDGLTLTLGKFASGVGGFEGNTTGPDLYLTSVAYAGSKAGLAAGKIYGLTNILYYTGAQLAYNINDTQKLELHIANTEGGVGQGYPTAATAGDVAAQNKTLTGLIYRGGFAEKTLNVLASYHFEDASGSGTKDNKVSLSAVGLEYLNSGLTAQLDFLMNAYERAAGGVPTTKDSLNSTVLSVKYKMEQWTPILKVAMTDEKIGAAAADEKNKYTDYGIALEYAPRADQVFRYHIAYNARSVKPDDNNNTTYGGKSPSSTQVVVGTRIYADFLK